MKNCFSSNWRSCSDMVEFASDVLFEDDVAVTDSVNVFESVAFEDDVWFEDDVAVIVSFIVFESVPLEEVAFEDVAFKDDVTMTVSLSNAFEDEVAFASVYQGMNIMVRHNRRIKPYTFINKEG